MGVAFQEETSDGRKCETTVTMEGNKLITSQKALKKGEKDVQAVSTRSLYLVLYFVFAVSVTHFLLLLTIILGFLFIVFIN